MHKLPGRLDDVLTKWNATKDRLFVRLTGQASINRIETALQNKLGDPDIAFRQNSASRPICTAVGAGNDPAEPVGRATDGDCADLTGSAVDFPLRTSVGLLRPAAL